MAEGSELKTVTAEAKALTKQASVFNADQQALLWRRTPKKHTFERPAKGGGVWTYVTGQYVEMYLNALTGHDWSFEIKEFKQFGDQVIVLGRLELHVGHKKSDRADIVKEQFGRADVKFKKDTKDPLDLGNDFKAAATDALKKCASLCGIAWDIYGKDEFNEIDVQKTKIPQAKNSKEAIQEELDRRKAAGETTVKDGPAEAV